MSAPVSLTTGGDYESKLPDCLDWLFSAPPSDDHSRVKLENSENDYINASLVAVEEAQRAYILSQVGARVTHVVCLVAGRTLVKSVVVFPLFRALWGIPVATSGWWFGNSVPKLLSCSTESLKRDQWVHFSTLDRTWWCWGRQLQKLLLLS